MNKRMRECTNESSKERMNERFFSLFDSFPGIVVMPTASHATNFTFFSALLLRYRIKVCISLARRSLINSSSIHVSIYLFRFAQQIPTHCQYCVHTLTPTCPSQ